MNNFNTSTSGVNLKLAVFRDTDASSRDFEESFNVLQYSGYRQNTIAVYTEYGNVSGDFSFSDAANYKITVKELRQALKNDYDTELSQHYFSKPFSKLTKAELLEFLDCVTYDSNEIAEFLQEHFSPLYDTLITRGYCQGDYAEVIIAPAYKQFLADNGRDWNKAEVQASVQTAIDHLFWDSPIYARLDIDGDEYFLEEALADAYEWDKEQALKYAELQLSEHEHKVYILGWLTANIPDYPDYQ
jgi:hypothetical protein